mmetsp:Transcript_13761/g.26686  ORF Transcript_13761/g.26686 Transcript_13761/m.26686 type:complete len:229 (-) Transcript_13761:1110-1796(-)
MERICRVAKSLTRIKLIHIQNCSTHASLHGFLTAKPQRNDQKDAPSLVLLSYTTYQLTYRIDQSFGPQRSTARDRPLAAPPTSIPSFHLSAHRLQAGCLRYKIQETLHQAGVRPCAEGEQIRQFRDQSASYVTTIECELFQALLLVARPVGSLQRQLSRIQEQVLNLATKQRNRLVAQKQSTVGFAHLLSQRIFEANHHHLLSVRAYLLTSHLVLAGSSVLKATQRAQ